MKYYVLIQWPEVQDLMEYPWFESECSLTDNSAYFVPAHRYEEYLRAEETISFTEWIKSNDDLYEQWSRNKISTKELYLKFSYGYRL